MELSAVVHLDLLGLLQVQLTCLLIGSILLGLIQVALPLPLALTAPLVQPINNFLLDPVVCAVLSIDVVLEVVDCVLVHVVHLVQVWRYQLVAVRVRLAEAETVVPYVILIILHRVCGERSQEA